MTELLKTARWYRAQYPTLALRECVHRAADELTALADECGYEANDLNDREAELDDMARA